MTPRLPVSGGSRGAGCCAPLGTLELNYIAAPIMRVILSAKELLGLCVLSERRVFQLASSCYRNLTPMHEQ